MVIFYSYLSLPEGIIQEGLPIKWCHIMRFTWLGLVFLPFSWSNNPKMTTHVSSLFKCCLNHPFWHGKSMIYGIFHRLSTPNLRWSNGKNHVKYVKPFNHHVSPFWNLTKDQKKSYIYIDRYIIISYMLYHICYMKNILWFITMVPVSPGSTSFIQEIVARAQEAAEEGVCHIELASEEPWFRSMGC